MIALATCDKYSDLAASDQHLIPAFADLGFHAEPIIWNDPDVNCQAFQAVCIRSIWDYHLHPQQFQQWLAQLEEANVPVFNPVSVLRWNMQKHYLRDLEAKGINIIPTAWITRGQDINLQALMDDNGWQQAVVKPQISASAYHTWKTGNADDQARFTALLNEYDLMVQPFVEAIQAGEWSIIFLGDVYSHAVLKVPANGAMYVQSELGGSSREQEPNSHLIEQAHECLNVAQAVTGSGVIYARVDGVVVDGDFQLMELELIEPELFLSQETAARFAEIVVEGLA